MASVSDADDARSIIDPGGTLEAQTTDSAVAPTLASQGALPQERSDDVDALLSTARSVSPQDSAGADDVAVSTAVETSSSSACAVDVIPAHPCPSGASDAISPPRPSLVGGATVPAVVETNSSGHDAAPSHGLSSDGRSGHPQVDDPTVEALIKTGSSDSGVVDVHGTSVRGASDTHRSQPPQDSSAVERVTVPAMVETGSSNTCTASAAFAPLGLSSAGSSTPTRGSAVVDDSVIPHGC